MRGEKGHFHNRKKRHSACVYRRERLDMNKADLRRAHSLDLFISIKVEEVLEEQNKDINNSG